MKRQGGFTLIELVVVIVILGILAVTAAPRFLNLQDDARNSALDGLKGAIAGAAGITYGKSAIEGVESLTGQTVSAGNTTITVNFGYPADLAALEAVVDGLETDWANTTSGAEILFGYDGYNERCVSYTPSTGPNVPAVTEVIEGCGTNF
ncbi:type II secretion system protein [Vibrio natriegens]|uniref:type II secretion system protein n=1 Tax=Vibrio natriegens TaxID=691 RepID=UPI003F875309